MPPLARLLILAGATLLALGLLLWLAPGARFLGRLPGDLRIARGDWQVFLPITTSLLLSVGLSLVLWLISRLR